MKAKASKVTAAPANSKNAQVELFVAEDIRREAEGKVTAVGLYPDRVIVILVPPEAPEPSKERPYSVASAAFLINIRNLVGEHRVSVDLGDGPAHEQSVSFADIGASVNLIAIVRPMLVHSFGVKTMFIKVDGIPFDRTFEIRRGQALLGAKTPTTHLEARGKALGAKASSKKIVAA
ncbi:MAG: hypothetical protein ABIR94_12600 [Rubrivivax sp.]